MLNGLALNNEVRGTWLMRVIAVICLILSTALSSSAFGAAAKAASCAPGKQPNIQTLPGMFTVHVVCERLMFEIPPKLLVYLRWNPLFPTFAALEQVFLGRWPSQGYLLASVAWAVGFFLLGAVVFLARERDFAVRL